MKPSACILFTALILLSLSKASGQLSSKKSFKKNQREKALKNVFRKESANDYVFSVATGTYTDLAGAVSLSQNQIWDDPEFAVPIGFNFMFYDMSLDSIYFGAGLGGTVSSKMNSSYVAKYMILAFETDLVDRGLIAGTSQSPISYKLEGTAGNRILKIEWKNAGFYDEGDSLGTLNDYINFQLWLYEGTNDIEIRFGSSQVTNPGVNYWGETGANIGLADSSLINLYLLSGPPANPVMMNSIVYLNGTPANGTIYKFSKKAIGIHEGTQETAPVKVYPNPFNRYCTIEADDSFLHDKKIIITDITGRIVKEINNIQDSKVMLDLSNFPGGIYYYSLFEKSKAIAAGKFIIE